MLKVTLTLKNKKYDKEETPNWVTIKNSNSVGFGVPN